MNRPSVTPKGAARALRDTIPVMFGYVPIGIAFGLLFTKAGYPWFYAVLMSIVIYSGATQFVALGFFVNSAATVEIAVTTLLINLRHSFFGLSLLKKFSRTGLIKPYLIFALTDETYALITSIEEPEDSQRSNYYFWVSFFDHCYWIAGTSAGALLGHFIGANLKGLEFALTALFVVLTIEQYRAVRTLRPFIVALAAGILSLLLVPSQYMLLAAIVTGCAFLLFYRGKTS